MAYPTWFDGKSVNEVVFCRAFLQSRPLKCIRGKLCIIDGEISDSDISHEISVILTEYVTTSTSRKVKPLLEALKLYCHSEPLQEYLGYCLILSTKGQAMLFLI